MGNVDENGWERALLNTGPGGFMAYGDLWRYNLIVLILFL